MERFDAPRALELIETHRCSVFLGVPTMHAMLAEAVRLSKRRFDLSSLTMPISSGARLTAQVAADFLETIGVPINEFYAASEIRPVFAYDLARGQTPRGGTVGPVAPGVEARIVGDDGGPVPVGVEGNLFVRSPTLMIDYYRDPALTASVMRDGWFDSGDRASIDADGIYSIGGRNKEMINRGGAKVAPAEVETVLLAHPRVREAAVLGVPDAAFGEQVKAVVVLHPGEPVSASSLRQHCRARLADFKVPGIVVFVDTLPVGPTGKLLRRALIDL
jgi:long-chain acyl-CoA synthetase